MTRDQLKKLERDLWAAADKLRANSDLKASEYSTPVLGLIFLKFADNKYRQHEAANQSLAVQRDALLPRLISGKLKVDHLDIRLPPSMRAAAETAETTA